MRRREGSQQPLILKRAERATSGLKFKRFRGLFGFALESPLRGDKCLSILHSDNSGWTFLSKGRRRGRVSCAFLCPGQTLAKARRLCDESAKSN